MKVWLSVDFDYFVRELLDWDWGHSEAQAFTQLMWPIREASFLAQGRSLREEMDPERHAEPQPGHFWKTLQRHGFRFDYTQVYVADSHKWATQMFVTELGGHFPPDGRRLVHFDAHHDLGYSVELVKQHIATLKADCADWHLMTLRKWRQLRSLIVYPAWKGGDEWNATFGRVEGKEYNAQFREQVQMCVWPDPQINEWAGEVEKVFICRSGSWVPPWLDTVFLDFVNDLAVITEQDVMTPFVQEEQVDPLLERDYDEKSVKAQAEVLRMDSKELAKVLNDAKVSRTSDSGSGRRNNNRGRSRKS